MISDKVSVWINEQMAQGKTVEDLNGTILILGDSVVWLKKSGKKFNLKIQVGCPVLR